MRSGSARRLGRDAGAVARPARKGADSGQRQGAVARSTGRAAPLGRRRYFAARALRRKSTVRVSESLAAFASQAMCPFQPMAAGSR